MNKYALRNRTKLAVLATDVAKAASLWDRMRGLLGHTSEDFRPGKGLWITPCQWIHTLGMSFPIDALYLDSNYEVVYAYRNLKPSRLASLKLRARSVIELPAGTVSETQTTVGDRLELEAVEER